MQLGSEFFFMTRGCLEMNVEDDRGICHDSVMNYGLVNCALSSYISASKGVKVFLLLQFRIEL